MSRVGPPQYLDGFRRALRSADRREEVVADGVADNDEWAPFERPDEIATAEVGTRSRTRAS